MYILRVEIHREITLEEIFLLLFLNAAFFLLIARFFLGFPEEEKSQKNRKNIFRRGKELEKLEKVPDCDVRG